MNDLSSSSHELTESDLASDEVIGETVEIETNSCPASPSMCTTTKVFTAPVNTSTNVTSEAVGGVLDAQPQDLSSKTSNTSPKKPKNGAQPAAIALPIDVPFIANDTVDSGPVTLEIIESGTGSYGSTSRQNLDTIVEAIRHLEGDHLFRDDDASVVVKQELEEKASSNAALSPALRTVLTMSPEQFGAIRHQVIQLQRPNVIVANHA